jgi:hypothetical protein
MVSSTRKYEKSTTRTQNSTRAKSMRPKGFIAEVEEEEEELAPSLSFLPSTPAEADDPMPEGLAA